jgi:hypothetical protein
MSTGTLHPSDGLELHQLEMAYGSRVVLLITEGKCPGMCILALMQHCIVAPLCLGLEPAYLISALHRLATRLIAASADTNITAVEHAALCAMILEPCVSTCACTGVLAPTPAWVNGSLEYMVTPTRAVLIVLTAGTVVVPQIVAFTQSKLVASGRALASSSQVCASDTGLSWMPLQTISGIVSDLIAPLMTGSHIVFSVRLNQTAWIINVETITWCSALPSIWLEIGRDKENRIPYLLRLVRIGDSVSHAQVEALSIFLGTTTSVLPTYSITVRRTPHSMSIRYQ